jgi:argininosuccinate lyase
LEPKVKPKVILKYVLKRMNRGLKPHFYAHVRIHKAHVLMLSEKGILRKNQAARILSALSTLEKKGFPALRRDWDPNTDLYMNTERYIRKQVGTAADLMHTGRSRNDLYATSTRIVLRENLNMVCERIIELRKSIVRLAGLNVISVMPGYTHFQHAEPITLGHFMIAFADALERDLLRLEQAYVSTNLNCLGAGALASTSFPIDQLRTTSLLGFDGIVENSYDAVASRDFMVEAACDLAILMSNVSRLLNTLITWSTSEFSFIDVSERYSYASSVLPQKKNPTYFMEACRAMCADVIGDTMSALCILHGTPFMHCRDTGYEINVPVFQAINRVIAVMSVVNGILSSAKANKQRMRDGISSGLGATTELANMLVREKNIPFRQAYQIVRALCLKVINERTFWTGITPKVLDDIALSVTGKTLGTAQEEIHNLTDPMQVVKIKRDGGPAPERVARMINDRSRRISREEVRLAKRRSKIERAYKKLEKATARIIGEARKK